MREYSPIQHLVSVFPFGANSVGRSFLHAPWNKLLHMKSEHCRSTPGHAGSRRRLWSATHANPRINRNESQAAPREQVSSRPRHLPVE